MRRPAAALLGTVVGTVLLIGAKYGATPAGNTSVADADADSPDEAGDSADPTAPDAPAPGATTGPAGSAGPSAPGRGASTPAAGRTTPAPGRTAAPPAPTTAAPACTNATGNAATIASPGVGAITVTIQVCGGVVKTASATQSRSNWDANRPALPSLNTLAVQYYKTNISRIRYSGATLTSNAYQASLRSALGKAGI